MSTKENINSKVLKLLKVVKYNYYNDIHSKELKVLNYYKKVSSYIQPKLTILPKHKKRITKKNRNVSRHINSNTSKNMHTDMHTDMNMDTDIHTDINMDNKNFTNYGYTNIPDKEKYPGQEPDKDLTIILDTYADEALYIELEKEKMKANSKILEKLNSNQTVIMD